MALIAESAAPSRPPGGALAGEPDLMGGVKLDDSAILDDHRHRAVAHALEQALKLGYERVQILRSRRIETGQRAPPGPPTGVIEEFDRLSRK